VQCSDVGRSTYKIAGVTFDIDARYRISGKRGQGAFGTVCEALDTRSGERVAIKRIANAFDDVVMCKRTLREIRMMRHFQHENILSLRDIMLPAEGSPWNDLYIVVDLMDTDLHYIIHSRQALADGHIRYFLYQLLRGLKAIHSAKAVHRDLKPSNLLVNANCDLRIADFGMARAVDESSPSQLHLTEYVVTRWYRAPELLAQNTSYSAAVDIWSVGCILAECLGRTALLTGKDYLQQIRMIVELVGTPTAADCEPFQNPDAVRYITGLPRRAGTPLSSLYPSASAEARDLLGRLLVFDPRRRPTAADALAHPYLSDLHDLNDAPDARGPFADVTEAAEAAEGGDLDEAEIEAELRAGVWEEMRAFHPQLGPAPPAPVSESPARVMDLAM